MLATHISHKIVFSAPLFMKKASWGYCVLVFDSSGEPGAHPGVGDSCAAGVPRLSSKLGVPQRVRRMLTPQ